MAGSLSEHILDCAYYYLFWGLVFWGAGTFRHVCAVSLSRNTNVVFLTSTSPFHPNPPWGRGEEEQS